MNIHDIFKHKNLSFDIYLKNSGPQFISHSANLQFRAINFIHSIVRFYNVIIPIRYLKGNSEFIFSLVKFYFVIGPSKLYIDIYIYYKL